MGDSPPFEAAGIENSVGSGQDEHNFELASLIVGPKTSTKCLKNKLWKTGAKTVESTTQPCVMFREYNCVIASSAPPVVNAIHAGACTPSVLSAPEAELLQRCGPRHAVHGLIEATPQR